MKVKALTVTVLLLAASTLYGAPSEPEWKIIHTKYPTTDIVIAGFNVEDFGAKGDGKKDCTEAFQEALDKMSDAGGGTVFVPRGQYVIRGHLTIPVSVTLRGDWKEPSAEDSSVKGTVLMAYADKGKDRGHAFITVDHSAGIKDLSIWYPEQSETAPVPYPFCLIQKGGDNATFENLTLVNPYQGIRIGPGGNELHYVHNVYGTPLKVGVQYDSTTDIGRLENLHFSPAYWQASGLKNAPKKGGKLEAWLKENGTALHMFRSDWEYVAYITIEGYRHGYFISEGVRGAANAQFYMMEITNCVRAIEVEKTNPFGMVFTKCKFDGSEAGIWLDKQFDSAVLFSNCDIGGQPAIQAEGKGNVLLENCRITRGNVNIDGGAFSMTDPDLLDLDSMFEFGSGIWGATLSDCSSVIAKKHIINKGRENAVKSSTDSVRLEPIPDYEGNNSRTNKPPKVSLRVVTPSGDDDTEQIQKEMDRAARNGGGTVFLPGGNYLLKGPLTIPPGVELRGVHDVPHHTQGGGSILHVYPPRRSKVPSITLQTNSILRGMSFNYPEQSIEDVKEYPFLLQGCGENIAIINVNAGNPYRFLDLTTHRCDNHFVDYLSGSPLLVGIAVGGGSENGEIRNVQFNPHYWGRVPSGNPFFANSIRGGKSRNTGEMLWTYQKENLDAIVVGDTVNQFLFQNFVYGSLYGIHFTRQHEKGPVNCICHGHGTDGSKTGVYFEDGSGKIFMINSELVAMSSEDKVAIKLDRGFSAKATLCNTMVWGHPDMLAEINNGSLLLQNLHCTTHARGILVNKGRLRAINVNFAERRGNHITTKGTARAEIVGCITKDVLTVNGDFFEDDSRGRITGSGNIINPGR